MKIVKNALGETGLEVWFQKMPYKKHKAEEESNLKKASDTSFLVVLNFNPNYSNIGISSESLRCFI